MGGRVRGGGAAGSRIALLRTFVAGRRRLRVIFIVHRRCTVRGGGRKASGQQEHVARDAATGAKGRAGTLLRRRAPLRACRAAQPMSGSADFCIRSSALMGTFLT